MLFGNRDFPNAKPLVAKGLCLHPSQRYLWEGFPNRPPQASITVDMGRFSARATFRQLVPSPRNP
jgi:hypothetical protein